MFFFKTNAIFQFNRYSPLHWNTSFPNLQSRVLHIQLAAAHITVEGSHRLVLGLFFLIELFFADLANKR